jgi:GTP-binding protein HflX
VRDISHPESASQARDVAAILESLGVSDKIPQIEVWNKIDRLEDEARVAAVTQAVRLENVLAISAVTGQGIGELVDAISSKLADVTHESQVHLSFDEGRKRAWLFEKDLVEKERQTETGFDLTVRWSARQEAQFREM